MENIKSILSEFFDKTINCYQQNGRNLQISYDSEWPSLCYESQGENGALVNWLPKKQEQPSTFTNIEEALSISLNRQYCELYSSFWSGNLCANFEGLDIELLMVWNQKDKLRLQENLIGHLLMKQRLKQDPTLFFGVTDSEDNILSVHNNTGEVILEKLGNKKYKVLAPNLIEFIRALSPILSMPDSH